MLQVNNGAVCTLEIRQLFGESCFAHTAVSEEACLLDTAMGQVEVITHLMSALWRASLMLALSPLNAEINPICHLLALLGAHHIFHVSRVRVNRSLINMEETFIDIPKVLASTISVWILHVSNISFKDYT